MKKQVVLAVLAVAISACTIEDSRDPVVITAPSPAPTPAPEPVRKDIIDYRVISNVAQVRIRMADGVSGTSQVITEPPYFTSIESDQNSIFLSLDVSTLLPTPVGPSVLSAQILVNGKIFREATSSSFLPFVSVSGTYRR